MRIISSSISINFTCVCSGNTIIESNKQFLSMNLQAHDTFLSEYSVSFIVDEFPFGRILIP